MQTTKFRILLVVGAVLLVIVARGYVQNSGPNEASVRDIAGISIRVDEAVVSSKGLSVPCEIENQTRRTATSVVFTVELATEDGRVLSANPLGNVLDLKPGESRSMQVPMPVAADLPAGLLTRAQVNLVRWQE